MTDKTTEALKLAAKELRNTGNVLMTLTVTRHLHTMYKDMRDDAVKGCNEAISAIREALAEQDHFAASGKLITDHIADADKMVVAALDAADENGEECLGDDGMVMAIPLDLWNALIDAVSVLRTERQPITDPIVPWISHKVAEPVKQEPVDGFFLPMKALNEPMLAGLKELIDHAKRGRWTNATVRQDGVETEYQADWIKSLVEYAAPVQPVKQEPVACLRSVLGELRNQNDSDATASSERKAGYHAALDEFKEAMLLAEPTEPVKQEPVKNKTYYCLGNGERGCNGCETEKNWQSINELPNEYRIRIQNDHNFIRVDDTECILQGRPYYQASAPVQPVKQDTPYCKSVPMCAKPCGDESCVEPVWILPGGGLVGKAEPVKQEPVAIKQLPDPYDASDGGGLTLKGCNGYGNYRQEPNSTPPLSVQKT